MVLLFDERIFEMTAQQPEDHIKNPYTLVEIKTKIASNDYNAEMLLQHAMLLLDGAALSANVGEPVAWYEYNESLDTWFLAYNHNPKVKTRPLVFGDGTNNLRARKPDTQAAPQPVAQGDALSWLQANDMAALERFAETTDDDESYDIGKDAVQRLAGFGCLRSHGFGKYSITDFGHYVLNDWSLARELPFKSQSEHAHGIGIKKGDSHD